MSTATHATDATTPKATTYREAPSTFLAAVFVYRNIYWSREFLALPAVEANRRANDLIGYRFFKATAGGKLAAMKLIARHWPELSGLPERTRFVVAVRESALGCLR